MPAKKELLAGHDKCKHEETVIRNYDPTWHDGNIHCKKCGKFIRFYDGG